MKLPLLYLSAIFFFINNIASAQSSQDIIKIDQDGYYIKAPKIAVLTSDYKVDEYAGDTIGFYILKADVGDTVYKGLLSKVRQSANSSIKTRIADFSLFQQSGTYVVYIPGIGDSYPFKVGASVHNKVAIAVLKGFILSALICHWKKNTQANGIVLQGILIQKSLFIHPQQVKSGRPALSSQHQADGTMQVIIINTW